MSEPHAPAERREKGRGPSEEPPAHSAPPVLAVEHVAQLLCCSPDTVRAMASSGELPALKPGRDWVFPAAALHQALNALAADEARSRREPKPAAAVIRQVAKPQGPPALPAIGVGRTR